MNDRESSSRASHARRHEASRPRHGATSAKQPRFNLAACQRFAVRSVMFVFLLGTIVGLAFFARPSVSEAEKRELTEFPAFTVESFLDGSYFTQVSLWYSDTYPLREMLVSADQSLNDLFGIQPETRFVGGNVQADELPAEGETSQGSVTKTQEHEYVDTPTEQSRDAEVEDSIMDGLYVQGSSAYSIYYFSQASVQSYAAAMNHAAELLDGQAQVYSLIVPNNSAALLNEDVLSSLGGTDQAQAIRYFFSLYDERVIGVDPLEALRAHRGEYIYFKTDHHWTQLGAYYAYQVFCQQKGIEPVDMLTWEKRVYQPFLGSFYTELGEDAAMAADPDYVEAYVPSATNDMTYVTSDGEELEGNVIMSVDGWSSNNLYSCFINGDQAEQHIHNPELSDGSACLVVKDSFGNAFVPMLVGSYEDVYVIDYRYSDASIPSFVREHGISDVIFVNNISLAGTTKVPQQIEALLYE